MGMHFVIAPAEAQHVDGHDDGQLVFSIDHIIGVGSAVPAEFADGAEALAALCVLADKSANAKTVAVAGSEQMQILIGLLIGSIKLNSFRF